ncbi:MAG: protein-L-isoaspartate(D-aspartate) O-methyltransferase [Gammaproteobacteria bacterium]|nr:MAG: protein-L-isoaspartate(D-aspartate) O-methyltransferase [Gammaproteobacteria bacterium]
MNPQIEDNEHHHERRRALVEEVRYDVARTARETGRSELDPRVLQALLDVPRHLFVPDALQDSAYLNIPLPVGHGATISQPYIVALMTDLLEVDENDRVLEIGTGSGYQSAILAQLVKEVYTIEIVPELYDHARRLFHKLGYANIHPSLGDGYRGWPEQAPFDGIIVTAAAPEIPPPLVEQLKPGRHLVIPVGTDFQRLVRVTRDPEQDRLVHEEILPVAFVPFTREEPRRPDGEGSRADPQ